MAIWVKREITEDREEMVPPVIKEIVETSDSLDQKELQALMVKRECKDSRLRESKALLVTMAPLENLAYLVIEERKEIKVGSLLGRYDPYVIVK